MILYIVGHFPNMLVLSILNFWSGDGVRCNSGNEAILLFICMLNPFTYNFFNPVLQYFICDEYDKMMVIIQSVFTILHLILGLSMFYAVIKLEQRSFIQTLRAEMKKEEEHHIPEVEQIDPEQLLFMAHMETGHENENEKV